MEKLTITIIKNTIKTIGQMYGIQIIIALFCIVGLVTMVLVLWETFTGKSIVDVLWDIFVK